jgi:hypothetical protein
VQALPPVSEDDSTHPGRAALDRAESDENTTPVEVGPHARPPMWQSCSAWTTRPWVLRRQVLSRDDERPVDLVTVWCPVELADGSHLGGTS